MNKKQAIPEVMGRVDELVTEWNKGMDEREEGTPDGQKNPTGTEFIEAINLLYPPKAYIIPGEPEPVVASPFILLLLSGRIKDGDKIMKQLTEALGEA